MPNFRLYSWLGAIATAWLVVFKPAVYGQDTFSIVAVDPVTREIGGAGASCVGGPNFNVSIINDITEGVGAIHTQALYLAENQQIAHEQMLMGKSPQEIIDFLVNNDAVGDPTVRQYGIVDLIDGGRSAAFTGENNFDWKGHVTGKNYAIQGNILLGPAIVDSMETAFLNSEGPLADRLMASLEAGMVPGADTRCLSRNTSSISAFIKVVRVGDSTNPFGTYLDLVVPNTVENEDPIAVLRTEFDAWKASFSSLADPFLSTIEVDPDTLPSDGLSTATIIITPRNNSNLLLGPNVDVNISNTGNGELSALSDQGDGTHIATLTAPTQPGVDTLTATVHSGFVTLANKPTIVYEVLTSVPRGISDETIPTRAWLAQNYPNPFNPSTTISFELPKASFVTLKVYNLLGQEVANLVNKKNAAGRYDIQFDASELSGGVYLYRLQAGEFVETRKLILLR